MLREERRHWHAVAGQPFDMQVRAGERGVRRLGRAARAGESGTAGERGGALWKVDRGGPTPVDVCDESRI